MSFLVSLVFGIGVGAAYALSGVRSPAPPLVALVGLLGIVAGEQGVAWLKHRGMPAQSVPGARVRTDASQIGKEPR